MQLSEIEWHDLPISELSIGHDAIRLVVTPYDDENDCYKEFIFTVSQFSHIELNIAGKHNLKSLLGLEITSFDYIVCEGKVSGEIGIIPGETGYWSIKVEDAKWTFKSNT